MSGITIVTGAPGAGKTTLSRRGANAGPWFLPVAAAELASIRIRVEYVVLQVGGDEAARRATSRLQQPGAEVVVRHMHTEFQSLGEYASHAFDTTDTSIDEAFAEFARRRSRGVFALDLTRIQAAACRTSR